MAPFLLERRDVEQIFPRDAVARARRLLSAFKGGVGAYTDSRGNPLVREEIAKFIEARDGTPSNPEVGDVWGRGRHVLLWDAQCDWIWA